MGSKSLSLRDRQVVIVKPIVALEFDNIVEFRALADKQDLPFIAVTEKAWSKLEGLMDAPESANS